MTLSKNKQIGSMFFVVFVVLVTFSIPNANANANANKESVDETNPVELENPVENIQPNKVSKNKKKKKRRNRKKI